jgi:hypothetical protein
MKSPLPTLAAAVALLALGACGKPAPEVIDTNPDPMANQLAHAKHVELPPAIKADKTLRCKDNSLVYVTFFEGDKQASVRTVKDGTATRLTAATAGEPLTADGGWKMTGSTDAITLTQPGKDTLTCKG